MMTRKDYIATAAILESIKDDVSPVVHFQLVDAFAEMMEKDNPRFQAQRFFIAAGVSK
jgi:hypothetical protein